MSVANIHKGEQVIFTADLKKLEAQRDALLAAAEAAEEWIATVTTYDDAVPYVNGQYDGFVDLIQRKLRQAIAACEEER